MFENRIIVRFCFETKFVISFVDSFFFFFNRIEGIVVDNEREFLKIGKL